MNKAIIHERGAYRPVGVNGMPSPPLPDDNWPYHNQPTTPHDSEFGIKNPKFERHIFIRRDQLLYDIDAQVQMVAMTRLKDDGTEDAKLTNATTTYQQMFCRWIDKHVGMAKGRMQTAVLEEHRKSAMNTVGNSDEIDICLLLPEWWDDTIFQQLTATVHDYIVNAVLQEFFTLTLTSKDPVTVDKATLAAEALADIKKLSNSSKPGRIRKPLKPF